MNNDTAESEAKRNRTLDLIEELHKTISIIDDAIVSLGQDLGPYTSMGEMAPSKSEKEVTVSSDNPNFSLVNHELYMLKQRMTCSLLEPIHNLHATLDA